jgi:hypothetical protein
MSSNKYESADLILKLYETRREPVMRQARDWFIREFNPETAQDVAATARGPHSAYYRMVTSYWDMACSFVNNGAIDAQMFNDANGEHNAVFSKIAPFVEEIRAISNNPNYMKNVEQLVMSQEGAAERLEHLRNMLKQMFQKPQDGDNAAAQAGS